MTVVEESAYAKINLRLKVVGRREDGYHLLSMLNVLLPLHDRLTLRVQRGAVEECRLQIDGPFAEQCRASTAVGDNLVERAVRSLNTASRCGVRVQCDLLKNIPLQAGLGGGSSDAAAVIRAIAPQLAVGAEERQRMAIELGADVPFFLELRRFAWVGGIGEKIVSLPPELLQGLALLVIKPPFGIATSSVFEALRKRPAQSLVASDRDCQLLVSDLQSAGTSDELDSEQVSALQSRLLALVSNDLEAPAIHLEPRIAHLLTDLRQQPGLAAGLSGSGSAVFALYRESDMLASCFASSKLSELRCSGVWAEIFRLQAFPS